MNEWVLTSITAFIKVYDNCPSYLLVSSSDWVSQKGKVKGKMKGDCDFYVYILRSLYSDHMVGFKSKFDKWMGF